MAPPISRIPLVPEDRFWEAAEAQCVDSAEHDDSVSCPRQTFEDLLVGSVHLWEGCMVTQEICTRTTTEAELEGRLCAQQLRESTAIADRLSSSRWLWALVGAAGGIVLGVVGASMTR
jgi:hypothetical protein